MDTNRSRDHEDASYSEDFEQDAESQDSPLSEEKVEIKVFKSNVGSLTVQPKKIPQPGPNAKKSLRTFSELSLFTKKARPINQSGPPSKQGSANVNLSGRSVSVKANNESRTSLVRLGTHNIRRQPLAQEKLDPHDVPASASISSMSRLSVQGNHGSYSRGAGGSIRRVVAHTAIKEKSYASAKYKAYTNPPLRSNNPPLKVGMARSPGNVAQRVASAKRMTIMDLKSKIKLLQDEIEKLKKENRFLNHLHHRQDNALKKWEGKDAELPKLLNQHKDEIRSLQEQLRKTQQHGRDHNEKIAGRDKKILRLENELDKLRVLVHEEHLQDRHTLQQDLDVTRMNLTGAEKRIREYMRHVDILEKNHRHQLAAQERKLIKVNTHTYELQQVVANLKLALRNKDRMLNYIQMRSSGRSLIRAFHAERAGNDDMLYGASLTTELSRPYQPPPIMKSHSFDFGNSRCGTPLFEEKRDFDFLHGKRRSDGYKPTHSKNRFEEVISRPSSRISQSLESVLGPSAAKSVGKSKSKETRKSQSIAQATHKSDKQKLEKSQSTPGKSILKKSQNSLDERVHNDVSSEIRMEKTSKGANYSNSHRTKHEESSGDKFGKWTENPKKKSSKNANVECTDSVELIYKGSTAGFTYEGPFMKVFDDSKQVEEDILESPTSAKLSEHTISSSQATTSSRSEILSNIDILSARIRESCVLVPPPEENDSLSRHKNDEDKMQPTVGPGGDNSDTKLAQMLISSTRNNVPPPQPREEVHQASSSTFHGGLFQPIYDLQDISSPQSHQTFVSTPRIQLNTLSLSSVASTSPSPQAVQSTTYQLAQPANPPTNISYMQTDPCHQILSPQPQTNITVGDQPTCRQIVESTALQYSPRQGYSAFNTVAVTAEPQSILGSVHQSGQQQFQSNSPRFPGEIPFYSFTSPDMQVPQPTSVTIIQTNPIYDQQIATRSNVPVSRSPQQPIFFTQSKPNAFPPVGFLNAKSVPDNEQTFPNPNSNSNGSKPNQPGYNPSYYVNLGSWK